MDPYTKSKLITPTIQTQRQAKRVHYVHVPPAMMGKVHLHSVHNICTAFCNTDETLSSRGDHCTSGKKGNMPRCGVVRSALYALSPPSSRSVPDCFLVGGHPEPVCTGRGGRGHRDRRMKILWRCLPYYGPVCCFGLGSGH